MSSEKVPFKFHRLYDILGPDKQIGGLIILNGNSLDLALLQLLWPLSLERLPYPVVCADGGANLLYRASRQKPDAPYERIPSHIVGDLDSVAQSVLQYYTKKGTRVTKDPDQDYTDFEKSIRVLHELGTINNWPTVVVGGHGGRLDQTLGNINTMFAEAEGHRDIWWLDSHNAALVLSSGRHHMAIDLSQEGPTCGIIPVGSAVDTVSTEGLQWNLDDEHLAFGSDGLVSSSNIVVEPTVQVETSHPVLWTIALKIRSA